MDHSSVMAVCGISLLGRSNQIDFYIQMDTLKMFWHILQYCLIEDCHELGIFFLDKHYLEINEVDDVIDKSCCPYSIFLLQSFVQNKY